MKQYIVLLLGLVFLAAPLQAASTARPIYVDPAGSDTEGTGTAARPFATVQRAASFIRARGWNAAMNGDLYVYLNPGTYYRAALTLTDADAASSGYTIRYVVNGTAGAAVLDGGVSIPDSAWQLVSGSEYRILLSQWLPTGYAPWTIYESGVRAIAARTPKLTASVFYPTAHSGYLASAGATFPLQTTLKYNTGDVTPGSWDLTRTRLRFWDIGAAAPNVETDWFETTAVPSAVSTGTQTFTISNPDGGGAKLTTGYTSVPARWFAEGDLSMLSAQGEFAVSGPYLYYMSRTGGAPAGVTIPTRKTIVSIAGSSQSSRVSGIAFDGLAIQDSDADSWTRFGQAIVWSGQDPDPATNYNTYEHQLSVAQAGGVVVTNADRIAISNTHLKNLGDQRAYDRRLRSEHQPDPFLHRTHGAGGEFSATVRIPAPGTPRRTTHLRTCTSRGSGN
jgi:hypothetical protein